MTDLNRSTIAQANATADASPEARGMDGLLATKLFVPRVQPGFVVRPRLLAQLDTGLARGIILVSAPAGFGKTVLLADWVRRGDGPVAWLSLDSGDNDPVRFWRHVAAALDRAVPGAADRVAPLLESAGPWFDGLVATLINEVADHPGEVLLVLDDLHLISSPPMLASLTLLLSYLPPNLRLVLASRSDPPVPLASLRAGGQLAEVRPADLRFTAEESGVLLRAAARADLPGSVTAALADQTEGWAAGLHLAALSLQESADPASVVATFSGAHRHVFDYLTEAVLDRQTGPVREFLLETSVLDRLSGPLCDAVTGRADGQQMLEAIERANLFLVPLDEVRGWWRYHHLFADVLQARLQQERPARAPHLHRAAARWHDGHGLMNDAIRHALDASDPALAARLIERHFDALVLRGEGATVQRWLALLPAEMTGARPRLLLAQARLALLSGRPEGVAGLLDAAEHAFAATADPPFVSSAGPAASLLNNPAATIALARGILAELRGDPEDASDYAAKALTRINPGEVALETITRGHLAVADWLRGRVSDAERSFTAQIAQFEAAGEINLAAWSSHYLGQVQRAQGRLDAATATYEHALTVATSPGRPLVPASGVALVGLAEIAYQRGEHDLALRHVTGGIALCRQLVYTQPLANGLATLAWIAWATGDATGAQAVIEDAMHAAPSPAVTNLLNTVPARRARLQLAQGNLAAAAAWIRARGLRPAMIRVTARNRSTWCWRGCFWRRIRRPGRCGSWTGCTAWPSPRGAPAA